MGEVYRARDTRLSREVALKVLPEEISGDRGRLSRFEKEARAASALNHPNIVTIYDMGSAGATFYIAMELVEGSTLRKLLVGGPLPVKKLLQVATQIADGLARAHEAGIVHRDLKPENVMVTKDGLVKILDFGLAKLSHAKSGSDEGFDLPSETQTSPGVVVGTASYMSPEQASGEAVDFRSDQFAFGSILYEMAAGKRAFQKKTGVDTLAAILNEEPEPIGAINPSAPAPLRWIVERCHAKEPEDRYAATRDLARELASLRDHLSETSASGASGVAPVPRRLLRRWQFPAALALLGGNRNRRGPAPAARAGAAFPASELPQRTCRKRALRAGRADHLLLRRLRRQTPTDLLDAGRQYRVDGPARSPGRRPRRLFLREDGDRAPGTAGADARRGVARGRRAPEDPGGHEPLGRLVARRRGPRPGHSSGPLGGMVVSSSRPAQSSTRVPVSGVIDSRFSPDGKAIAFISQGARRPDHAGRSGDEEDAGLERRLAVDSGPRLASEDRRSLVFGARPTPARTR